MLPLLSQVISCFGLAVTSRLYLGFAVVSLLVEINSVFLHIRQLLLLSGQRNRPGGGVTAPRPTVTYTTNCWLNLGTWVPQSFCPLYFGQIEVRVSGPQGSGAGRPLIAGLWPQLLLSTCESDFKRDTCIQSCANNNHTSNLPHLFCGFSLSLHVIPDWLLQLLVRLFSENT